MEKSEERVSLPMKGNIHSLPAALLKSSVFRYLDRLNVDLFINSFRHI